jgi:hypothetical protein
MYPQSRGERTINSNNISLGIVNHDRVRNGINDADPALSRAVHFLKQARVFEQAAKTHAEERETLQEASREIRRTFPGHKSRVEAFVMAEKWNGDVRQPVLLPMRVRFLRKGQANHCFPGAFRLGKAFRGAGQENFSFAFPW